MIANEEQIINERNHNMSKKAKLNVILTCDTIVILLAVAIMCYALLPAIEYEEGMTADGHPKIIERVNNERFKYIGEGEPTFGFPWSTERPYDVYYDGAYYKKID